MNILFYLHQFPAIGGIETVTATLANYFAGKGHAVSIVSHISKSNANETVALNDTVSVFKMPEEVDVSRINASFLHDVINKRRIDVVIFQDSYAEIEKNIFASRSQKHTIVCEHSSPLYHAWRHLEGLPLVSRLVWHLRHPFIKWRRFAHSAKRKRLLYDKADRYVLLSDRFFGEFKAVARLWDTRKLRAIPNPLLPFAARPQEQKQNEIVFASTLNWDKGLQRVLPLWKDISSRFADWRFTIVGDGEMMEWAKEYIRTNGLDRVSLEGYTTDCSRYFARAKILVYPSSRDGWGLILVEAMANGCVPVAFDSYSAIRDIIDDGHNGLLVPAYDEIAYKRAIEDLMSSSKRISQLADSARTKTRDFSVDKVGAQWDALLDEVVSRGGGVIVVEHNAPYYERHSL